MAGAYTEDSYEKSVVELFQNMGYTFTAPTWSATITFPFMKMN